MSDLEDSNSNIAVVAYPDIRLRTPSKNVTDFSDPQYLKVVEELTSKMAEFEHCVGLAANQIGSDLNIFVVDASKNNREESKCGFMVIVNAKIMERCGEIKKREGCMSVTDLTVDVTRSNMVTIDAQDKNGDDITILLEGFESRVFQHEIDHLRGKVILDCARSSRDIFPRKHYTK